MEERAARQSLTATLDKERRQREAVEGKLHNMQASLRKQQQRAAKMEKYEQIMGTLMNVRVASPSLSRCARRGLSRLPHTHTAMHVRCTVAARGGPQGSPQLAVEHRT